MVEVPKVRKNELVERDGLYYEKFTDVPFTGKVTGSEEGSFKNGERDGPWVSYYDDDDNGQLRNKGNYKNGMREGPWVSYRDDGTVNEDGTGTYKNGVKVD